MIGDVVFFFTQKTAYEMRISDGSSDVCSSDLLGLASRASPASAQDTQTATPPAADTSAQDTEEAPVQDIVVTGSILKTDTATPSPVTTITVENLDQRGISTTQDAIQSLSANNGPALTNSFSANGAFAGGASAVSLRGLSTNSTLVLFDGMRAAYYPLADDGTRNFVDLNTIPDDIIDQVQVVREDRKSTRLNSSHYCASRMPSSALK